MWILRRGQAVGRGALDASAAAAYSGPGDIVSGATTWASSARAYTAAFAATAAPIMDLVDQAGANPVTINILTTGFADVTAITNWVSANSVSTIKIAKLYDQTGNGNHWTQATLANMPTLTLSALNGLPGITCASASAQRLDTAQTITLSTTSSYSAVAKRTANFTTKQSAIGTQPTFPIGIGFEASANTALSQYNSSGTTVAATDSVFHAMQGIINGSSLSMEVDGASASTSRATSTQTNQGFRLGRDQGGNFPLDGIVMEVGVWTSTAFSAGNITSINSNQHGTSGYNF